jgi:hypothetical protein
MKTIKVTIPYQVVEDLKKYHNTDAIKDATELAQKSHPSAKIVVVVEK